MFVKSRSFATEKQTGMRLVIGFAVILLLFGVAVTLFFSSLVNFIIGHELVLRRGADSFKWWSKPPVIPEIRVYIFNVTNADEFLNNGTKPILDELGPYVYKESWERRHIHFNDNGTVSYNLQKIYVFDEEASGGLEDDVVVVPNIPMLSATSQSKHAARFLRLAMASIMDILKIKPFVEVSVGQLLWGYEDPLLKLAKDVVSKDQKLPYEEFGLLYGKNGTSQDRVTVFTGEGEISNIGQIDKYNGRDSIVHWTKPECASIKASDGSLFPPFMDKTAKLYIYDKDLCRRLPLVFEKEVVAQGNVTAYRFTPPQDVFASVDKQPENMCYCPHGPPCAPHGLFNVSLCQYDSPVMLSFPHFYLADDSLRTAVEGISPPDPEKHKFSIDVSPLMGVTLGVKARVQMNLAVTQVIDIKQVATFPDIVFPIIWFEEIVPGLPEDVTNLVKLASNITPIARTGLMIALYVIGTVLLVVAIFGLIKAANAHSTLRLNNPIAPATPAKRGHVNNAMQMESVGKY